MRRAGGLALALLAALVLAWFLLQRPDTTVEVAEVAEETAPEPPVALHDGDDVAAAEAELFILTNDGTKIPKTEQCVLIAEWTERHVPHFTIADNIRDRAMLFTEDDVACLTASTIPPFVLTYADLHMKRERKPR